MSVTALQRQPIFQGLVAVNDNKEPPAGEQYLGLLLGELRGELRGIKDTLSELKDDIEHASTSRSQLHEKMSLIDQKVSKLEGTVTVMGGVVAKQTTRIDKIEPVALWLIAIASGLLLIGGALWYGILNYGADVVKWINAVLTRV